MNWIIKSPFKNIRDLSNYLVKSTNNHDAQEKQEDSMLFPDLSLFPITAVSGTD